MKKLEKAQKFMNKQDFFIFLFKFLILNTFILIFINCSSQEKKIIKPNLSTEEILESGDYYQKIEIKSNDSYLESSSNKTKFLSFRKSGDQYFARELEITLFAFNDEFLKNVSNVFQGRKPKKYSIEQKLKTGNVQFDSKLKIISVEFENSYYRKIEEDDLLDSIDSLLSEDFLIQNGKSKELIFYQIIDNNELWIAKEQINLDSKTEMIWKNYTGGPGILKKVAFSEYIKNQNEIQYSRIHDKNKYLYLPLTESSLMQFLFYQDSDFIVSYSSDDYQIVNESENLLEQEKKQLHLFKNKLPILVQRKTLKNNGN
jgi:hypothetical protein